MTKFALKDGPPTGEEMLAYLHGDLSADEEASFRSRVIDYPELVRVLVAEFPEPAQRQDSDYLSEQEFARLWDDFQQRIAPPAASVPFWRGVAAFAAAVAVVFASMYWKARVQQRTPHVISTDAQLIYPDGGARGGRGNTVTIAPAGDAYLLMPVLRADGAVDSYDIELFDESAGRSIWSKRGIRNSDSMMVIVVPRSFVRPGVHRLSVSGAVGGRQRHLNDYTIRLTP